MNIININIPKEFEKDVPKALAILKEGGEKTKKIASKKMKEIKEKIGVNVYEK